MYDKGRGVTEGNKEAARWHRIADTGASPIKAVIAGAVRYRQRVLIKNFDKANRVTTRTDISFVIQILRAEADEWRPPDKILRMFVE